MERNEAVTRNKCLEVVCDNAPEFVGANCAFQKFMENKAKIVPSTPHTPNENAEAKNANRRQQGISDAILLKSKLGVQYWAEANRFTHWISGFTLRTIGKTTKTINTWYYGNHKKPSISHVKTFGCITFVFIPKSQ